MAEALLKAVQAVFLAEGVHPAEIVELGAEGTGPADHLRLHGVGGHQVAFFVAAGAVNVKDFTAVVQRDSSGQRFALVFRQAEAAVLGAVGFQHPLEIIQRAVADAVPLTGFQIDAKEGFQRFGAGPAGGDPPAGGQADIIAGLFAERGHQLLQGFALQRQEHIKAGLNLIVHAAVAGAAAQPHLSVCVDQGVVVGRFGVEPQQKGPVLFQDGDGFPQQGRDGLGIVGVADRPARGVGQRAARHRGSEDDAEGGGDAALLLQIDLLADPALFDIGPAAVLHQVAPAAACHKVGIAPDGGGIGLLENRHDGSPLR